MSILHSAASVSTVYIIKTYQRMVLYFKTRVDDTHSDCNMRSTDDGSHALCTHAVVLIMANKYDAISFYTAQIHGVRKRRTGLYTGRRLKLILR